MTGARWPRLCWCVALCWGLHATGWAGPASQLPVLTIEVTAAPGLPALVCPARSKKPSPPPQDPAEVLTVPDEEDVAQELADTATAQARSNRQIVDEFKNWGAKADAGRAQRWAIWGDSHMAAAFFSDQLKVHLQKNGVPVQTAWIPANFGHAGVRTAMRKTCVSSHWRLESAHASESAAQRPGPGLVSLKANQADATIELDLRQADLTPQWRSLRILYEATEPGTQLSLRVDGQAAKLVTLPAPAGPSVIEVVSDKPISVLTLQLREGAVLVQGLHTPVETGLTLDVFGQPGATADGWRRMDKPHFASWFGEPYDTVILAYGTNEGNVKPFKAPTYRSNLQEALQGFRHVFPQAACVLIAPGDRGVLVKKRNTKAGKKAGKNAKTAKAPKGKTASSAKHAQPAARQAPVTSGELLQYARIHAQIGDIQAELAPQFNCQVWSMQDAMGGVGASYKWFRKTPPLMAADLIHFTAAGYRELANLFVQDMGLALERNR